MKKPNRIEECDCGCGNDGPRGAMKVVRIASGGRGRVEHVKTFHVLRSCEEPFQKELAMTQECVRFLTANSRTGFVGRVLRFKQLVKLQHAIHERRYGFDHARKTAIRSGIVFVVPMWASKLLVKIWGNPDLQKSSRSALASS